MKSIFFSNARISISLLVLLSLYGCGGGIATMAANSFPTKPRNYLTAGFKNSDEVFNYARIYKYLAFKMTRDEMDLFYIKFPEYWLDLQDAKSYSYMNDYNAGYTAYAFRWTTMIKKNDWDDYTVKRLESKNVIEGDDIFKIMYSLGAPERFILDNDFDVMIFKDNFAIILENEKFKRKEECNRCTTKMDTTEKVINNLDPNRDVYTYDENQILKILKLNRPTF